MMVAQRIRRKFTGCERKGGCSRKRTTWLGGRPQPREGSDRLGLVTTSCVTMSIFVSNYQFLKYLSCWDLVGGHAVLH